MTEFLSDPTGGQAAAGDEPAAGLGFTGFDAELAAAMKHLGAQAGPEEFDSGAIRRRVGRRKTARALVSSVAAVAVVGGVTAFAAQHGPAAASGVVPASPNVSGNPAGHGTDPLVLPGYIGAQPAGVPPLSSAVYLVDSRLTGIGVSQDVQSAYSFGGTEYTMDVMMMGVKSLSELPSGELDGYTAIGTVAGHTAYRTMQPSVLFWSGPQGYAEVYQVDKPLGNANLTYNAALLLGAAKAFVGKVVDVPLPVRITGLDSAQVNYALITQADPGTSHGWTVAIRLTIDGRSYEIDANPGPVVTPSATASDTTGGEYPAMETVDGIGISVSTDSGTSGSPSAPTVSQVLAHVTSLGADPSAWTTDVVVK
jgi:hypothetical protein